MALLSPLEKRAINLTWAKPFDGNSPLLHYVLEVSENSKAAGTPTSPHTGALSIPGQLGPGGWAVHVQVAPGWAVHMQVAPGAPWLKGRVPAPSGHAREPRWPRRQAEPPASALPLGPADAPWTILLPSVDPEATSVVVRGLVPARSYQFRLCAVNDVGKGQFSKDTER